MREPQQRKIIHIDMDAFFASVEQRDHPDWRGRPLVVGGSPHSRGVVAAASYEARAYGIRSAMSCAKAYRLCPETLFVRHRFDVYKSVSQTIHGIFRGITDIIEPLSLDEAYLDVTANKIGEQSATRLAETIRERIWTDCQLTASAGVSCNKLIAKIASDENKPNGICVVKPDNVADFLAPKALKVIPGIGPKTFQRCQQLGYETCHDLRNATIAVYEQLFGSHAERMQKKVWGIDHSSVKTHRQRKSISIEDTFAEDIQGFDAALPMLSKLAEGLCKRCERARVMSARTLTLKIKYQDFRIVTRTSTCPHPISVASISACASQLLLKTAIQSQAVRLLGIGLSGLNEVDENQQTISFD